MSTPTWCATCGVLLETGLIHDTRLCRKKFRLQCKLEILYVEHRKAIEAAISEFLDSDE